MSVNDTHVYYIVLTIDHSENMMKHEECKYPWGDHKGINTKNYPIYAFLLAKHLFNKSIRFLCISSDILCGITNTLHLLILWQQRLLDIFCDLESFSCLPFTIGSHINCLVHAVCCCLVRILHLLSSTLSRRINFLKLLQ